MQICVFIEPHRGARYETQRRFAVLAEQAGFDGFFRADHLRHFGTGDGLPGPTDAWLTLAALGRDTTRIRLGTLVSAVTFRLPGPLAITVAQADEMSGGRVELGLGTGWYEREHLAYGIPFPPLGQRFRQLAEQLQVIRGLWRTRPGDTYSFHGRHYTLVDAPALPKPVQPGGPPLIVGGRGARRTPALAARYADEFNAGFLGAREAAARFATVRKACAQEGRDRPLRFSGGILVACGRTDAEVRRRAATMYEPGSALPPHEEPAVGPPSLLVDRVGELAAAGADRCYLRLADLTDLDHLDLIATQALPQLSA